MLRLHWQSVIPKILSPLPLPCQSREFAKNNTQTKRDKSESESIPQTWELDETNWQGQSRPQTHKWETKGKDPGRSIVNRQSRGKGEQKGFERVS